MWDMAGLGKEYGDGEIIVRQGETGNCMYVVQEGQVEVVDQSDGKEVVVRTLGRNDFFGEMALFEKDMRTVTIRATGKARVLTIDRKQFLRGIHEDPSLAMRVIKTMSHRIRDLTGRLGKYEQSGPTDRV
jgi:CRP-like cAMP-binding protein